MPRSETSIGVSESSSLLHRFVTFTTFLYYQQGFNSIPGGGGKGMAWPPSLLLCQQPAWKRIAHHTTGFLFFFLATGGQQQRMDTGGGGTCQTLGGIFCFVSFFLVKIANKAGCRQYASFSFLSLLYSLNNWEGGQRSPVSSLVCPRTRCVVVLETSLPRTPCMLTFIFLLHGEEGSSSESRCNLFY